MHGESGSGKINSLKYESFRKPNDKFWTIQGEGEWMGMGKFDKETKQYGL